MGAWSRLSEEQQLEVLAHIEDSVTAKVREGLSEADSIGRAFEEFGDIERIAKPHSPLAVTPEGGIFLPSTSRLAVLSYVNIAIFCLLQWFVTPKFDGVLHSLSVELPFLTKLFLRICTVLCAGWPVALVALIAVAWSFRWVCRRIPRPVWFLITLAASGLVVGLLLALALPLLKIEQGLSR